ncbi:hypothetical protein [Haematobacter missouriensis]|uniref:Uncharacterized protein n=1 Tax=Haematobacter missouriensis TaxID=366616 RepID=A0ABX3ZVS4_9RHOB|nr:hypothetical protein [Haematobacter missouriensis]OWJ77976.1 hypothetical protein CDV53_04470 [Haematobacter missouriensis]
MAEPCGPDDSNLRTTLRNRLLHQVYLAGYCGTCVPRWLRRLLADSDWHRAWLLGHMRFFVEDGVAYGPANTYPGPRIQDQV